jgi:hypothetical protein
LLGQFLPCASNLKIGFSGLRVARAIQLAGIEVGMFTERKEISHPKSSLDNLSDLELVQVLYQEAQALLEHYSGKDGEDRS